VTEQQVPIRLTVNGTEHRVEVPVRRLLSDALRYDIGLTGTHVGCDPGVCGACTVLLDGVPVRSCLLLAATVDGGTVTTVEGLAGGDGTPHPVQQAFKECHGLQCGFCTPGMVMATVGLLRENPDPTEAEVREGLEGNICRCTGYHNIVRAVQTASGQESRPAALEETAS
jgi:aerobic carbon-monoxide dehydrogenase small subunit